MRLLYMFGVMCLVCIAFASLSIHTSKARVRASESIDIGMGIEDAISIIGHNPDFICVYKDAVLYYFCPKWSVKFLLFFRSYSEPEASVFRNVIVRSKKDIPDIYDAFQLLSDEDGKIRAIAWNGEGRTIRTEKGEMSGGKSNCNSLPDEFFEVNRDGK